MCRRSASPCAKLMGECPAGCRRSSHCQETQMFLGPQFLSQPMCLVLPYC